jgi:hypothetical protein
MNLYSEQPLVYVDNNLFGYDPINYNFSPTVDELVLNSLTEPYIDDFNLYHLRESIFNKWGYVDYYSRKSINNYFLEQFPEYWTYDFNNFNEPPDSFIRYLLNNYPYSIRKSYDLLPEDIRFLVLLDKSLSLKLDKKVKDECEKTKIEGITRKVWYYFSKEIKEETDLDFKMIDKFKSIYSQYDKDTDHIRQIYNLLKKCYKNRLSKTPILEIKTLLGLFDGCDMNNFRDAIEKYEKSKKYLLNKKL